MSRPVVVSPGLGPQEPIRDCVRACAAVAPTVLLLHAPDRQGAAELGLDDGTVEVRGLDSAEQAFALIAGASVVVTGRIHALLSAIIHGTPAIFLGPWYDSRYSLVEDLGVPIEPPVARRIARLVEAVHTGELPPSTVFGRAARLRANLVRWLHEVAAPLGVAVPALPGVLAVRPAEGAP